MVATQAAFAAVLFAASLPLSAVGNDLAVAEAVCNSEDCFADTDLGVEAVEELEAQALRTELLQLEVQQIKGPHRARRTPMGSLVGAVLDAQADSDIALGRHAVERASRGAAPVAAAPAATAGTPASEALGERSAAASVDVALHGGGAATTSQASSPAVVPPSPGAAVHGEHGPTVHVPGHGKDDNYMTQAAIPVGAFIVGGIILLAGQKTAGILAIYFGAQAGFSLYMKVVLSNAYVSQELKMKGVPAAFLVTAVQQVVAFIILTIVLGVLRFTPKEWLGLEETYRPKQLTTSKEWIAMLIFAVAFACNIGLNNFSLSLLTVSLNLIIRSCLPLVTLFMQLLTGTAGQLKGVEVALMFSGVFFAGLATVASSHGHKGSAGASHLILGVIMCAASDIAAAGNLVLASIFGTSMKLNPLDTTFYMAVPAAISLLPAVFLLNHPVDWQGFGPMTDWEVFLKVLELSPFTLSLIGLSGLFAVGYNVLQYSVVQSLSASHAAFAGNFNKAATIMLSICLGLESLPSGAWSGLMMFAILGNIASFTSFSMLKGSDKKHGDAKHMPAPPQGETNAKA